jgi:hypothetical protein
MSSGSSNPVRLEAMRSEIEALRASAEHLLFAFDRVMSFGLVFIVGAIGLAFTADEPLIIPFTPFIMAIILVYLIAMNTEGLNRAGHKRCLEEYVNVKDEIGSVYVEESHVAPTRQGRYWFGRVSVAMIQLMLGLLLLVLFMVGFVIVQREASSWWLVLYTVGIVYALIALGAGMSELSTAYQRGYEAAKAGVERSLATQGGQLRTPGDRMDEHKPTGAHGSGDGQG